MYSQNRDRLIACLLVAVSLALMRVYGEGQWEHTVGFARACFELIRQS